MQRALVMALMESAAEFGQPDFILVDEITEEAFLANLKLRYEKGKVIHTMCQYDTAFANSKRVLCNSRDTQLFKKLK